jgi:hypothetical protein
VNILFKYPPEFLEVLNEDGDKVEFVEIQCKKRHVYHRYCYEFYISYKIECPNCNKKI